MVQVEWWLITAGVRLYSLFAVNLPIVDRMNIGPHPSPNVDIAGRIALDKAFRAMAFLLEHEKL
jgi:hypothetical protein